MFRVFDLLINSNISLPELSEIKEGVPSLSFALLDQSPEHRRLEFSQYWQTSDGQVTVELGKIKDSYCLRFPQLADFVITSSLTSITCFPQVNVPEETVRHLLLDQVIPRVISYQGRVVLHASAVKVGKGCIIILGDSGWGKSTLAASLHRYGREILTDDCLLLKRTEKCIAAVPSYCGVRLLKDSFEFLAGAENKSSPVAHYSAKQRLDFNGPDMVLESGLPILSIFVLTAPEDRGNSFFLSIEPLSSSRLTTEFLKHSFQMEKIAKFEIAEKLKWYSGFTRKNIPAFTLSYTRDLSFLDCIHSALSSVVKKYQKELR